LVTPKSRVKVWTWAGRPTAKAEWPLEAISPQRHGALRGNTTTTTRPRE